MSKPHKADGLKRKGKKIEFIRCDVLFPYSRYIAGQLMMLEPALSTDVALPNDNDTRLAIEQKWLKQVGKPFMAEPSLPI